MQETCKSFCRQTYSFLEVKLRHLRRKTYDDKYDIRDKNQHTCTVLANSFDGFVLIKQPGPASSYRMQVSNMPSLLAEAQKSLCYQGSNMFTVHFLFCPSMHFAFWVNKKGALRLMVTCLFHSIELIWKNDHTFFLRCLFYTAK